MGWREKLKSQRKFKMYTMQDLHDIYQAFCVDFDPDIERESRHTRWPGWKDRVVASTPHFQIIKGHNAFYVIHKSCATEGTLGSEAEYYEEVAQVVACLQGELDVLLERAKPHTPFWGARKQNPEPRNLSRRFRIFKRDNYRCQICGRSAQDGATLEVDHRVPRAKGGTDDSENLWTLCFDCNRGKRDINL